MALAKIISARSTCNSRPTGAVIVRDKQILSTGFNGSLEGVDHCIDGNTINGRPFCYRRYIGAPEEDKYNFCRASHAEANAVSRAAKYGISLQDSTLFVTLAPCYVCLKQCATAGIKHIFYEYQYHSTNKLRDKHWRKVISESPIKTFEQLTLSSNIIQQFKASLRFPTSRRRLSESTDNPCKIIDTNKNNLDDQILSLKKNALLEVISGQSHQNQVYSKDLVFTLNLQPPDRIEDSTDFPDTPISGLYSMDGQLIEGTNFFGWLLEAMYQEGSASGKNEDGNICFSTMLSQARMLTKVDIKSCDVLYDLESIISSFYKISTKAASIIDKEDKSIRESNELQIHIIKPYIEIRNKEQAKDYILSN